MSDRVQEFRKEREQLNEMLLAIGLVAGGSITIPHLRRTNRLWKEVQ